MRIGSFFFFDGMIRYTLGECVCGEVIQLERYETKIKFEHINRLAQQGRYEEAMQIANTVDWDKTRNFDMLCNAGEVYERCSYYEDSKAIYTRAYQLNPQSRIVIYRLTELSIKLKDYEDSIYFYKQYEKIAPYDVNLYVLQYKIYKARGASPETLISILEELNENDYHEHWAYELARLYQQSGQIEKCVKECDEIYLWFGSGRYVTKALRLKQKYAPLTPEQREKLDEAGLRPVKVMETIGREESARERSKQYQAEFEAAAADDPEREKARDAAIEASREARAAQLLAEAREEEEQEETALDQEQAREVIGVPDVPRLDIDIPQQEEVPQLDLSGISGRIVPQPPAEEESGQAPREGDTPPAEGKEETVSDVRTQDTREDVSDMGDRSGDGGRSNPLQKMWRSLSGRREEEEMTVISGDTAENIQIPPVHVGRYDTVNLQKELAENVKSLLSGKNEHQEEPEDVREDPEPIKEETSAEERAAESAPEHKNDGPKQQEQIEGQMSLMDWMEQKAELQAAPDQEQEQNVPEEASGSVQDVMEEDEMRPETQAAVKEARQLLGQENVSREALESALKKIADLLDPEPLAEVAVTIEPEGGEIHEAPEAEADREPAVEETMEEPTVEEPTAEEPAAEPAAEETPAESTAAEPETEEAAEEPAAGPEEEVEPVPVTEEQREIMSYFLSFGGVEDQIIAFLERGADHREHIMITGVDGSGKTSLATRLVKAIAAGQNVPAGKMARLEASVVNRKPLRAVMDKVGEGTIVIEHAGELEQGVSEELLKLMEEYAGRFRFVIMGEKGSLEEMLAKVPGMKERFALTVDLPIYTNDQLVEFGKQYALSQGYAIDEIAVLALYTRLSDEKHGENAISLGEVKNIIDNAIVECLARKGMKKFLGGLFSQNIDDEGNIILKEEDFGVDA